jgi:hypothetical protein
MQESVDDQAMALENRYFKEFYGRELLNVTDSIDESVISAFISDRSSFIVKPTEG